ncbi:MAG TPA: hypothetical protein VEW46_23995, partial [Pyrinomonadaceae bacterium]|nr:hypothetical protein [Pyrinomonadaceae bacterium]
VASPFAKRKQRNSFRVAKNLLERLEPRVSKPTLGWNSRTLSALLVVPSVFTQPLSLPVLIPLAAAREPSQFL